MRCVDGNDLSGDDVSVLKLPWGRNNATPTPAGLVVLVKREKPGDKEESSGTFKKRLGPADGIKARKHE